MVISPTDIVDCFERADRIKLNKIEERIDQFLEDNYRGNGPARYQFDEESKILDPYVLDKFLDTYREAGWSHVNIRPNLESGEYIEFCYSRSKMFGSYKSNSFEDNIIKLFGGNKNGKQDDAYRSLSINNECCLL